MPGSGWTIQMPGHPIVEECMWAFAVRRTHPTPAHSLIAGTDPVVPYGLQDAIGMDTFLHEEKESPCSETLAALVRLFRCV